MNTDKTPSYNFTSQLELGELMLRLGRTHEAALELRKAELLLEAEQQTVQDDANFQREVERLDSAIQQVASLEQESQKSSKVLMFGLVTALIIATVFVSVSWVFSRAKLTELTDTTSIQAEQLVLIETELADAILQKEAESTRLARQVKELHQELSAQDAFVTELSKQSDVNKLLAEMILTKAAEAVDSAETQTAQLQLTSVGRGGGGGAGEPFTLPDTTTPSETASTTKTPSLQEIRLRITAKAVHLRRGPDFNYVILNTLSEDMVVDLIAQSRDGFWYNICTDDGQKGWVHASLAKAITLDWLPVSTTIPRPIQPVQNP